MGRGRQGSGVTPLKTCINIRFTWLGKRYVESLKMKPSSANIRFATQLMEKIRAEIAAGTFDYAATFQAPVVEVPPEPDDPAPPITLGFTEFSERWLRTVAIELGTRSNYRSSLRKHWQPLFGDRDIREIKPSEIKEAIALQAGTMSAKGINNTLIPLRQMYLFALDDELLDRSPMTNIRNRKHQAPGPDPFDAEEMMEILDYLRQHDDELAWNWYEFAFSTGLRPSEQIALKWADIDWRRATVRVERALVKTQIKNTKTNSARDVDLNDRAMSALIRQKAHSFMFGSEAMVFLNPLTREPWPDEKQQRTRHFLPALQKLGIRRRTPYQTRHTFATIALMGGVNPAYIARQLGHTTTAMLFKHYARWIDGADRGREAAKLAALFGDETTDFSRSQGYATYSFNEFIDDVAGPWRSAGKLPVMITDRGRPSRVLISIEAYRALLGSKGSLTVVK